MFSQGSHRDVCQNISGGWSKLSPVIYGVHLRPCGRMISIAPPSYLSRRHLYDRSMIVPGSCMVYSARNASASTTRCCAVLNGAPKGWPNGHLRKMVLGGLTCSEYSRTIDTPIVGIPSFSISRCINPTDWLQMPHPGVRRTISTLSFFNRSATSGALLLISVRICLPVIWPMNP
jgi:hypothetical protein